MVAMLVVPAFYTVVWLGETRRRQCPPLIGVCAVIVGAAATLAGTIAATRLGPQLPHLFTGAIDVAGAAPALSVAGAVTLAIALSPRDPDTAGGRRLNYRTVDAARYLPATERAASGENPVDRGPARGPQCQ